IASSASRLPVTLANNIVTNALHRASHNSVERRMSGLLAGVVHRLVNIELELNKDWQSDRESEQNQRRTLVVNRSFIRVSALALTILFELAAAAQTQDPLDIKIGYLRRPQQQETISLIQMPPPDIGLAGAQMAVKDNNTTGRFLNQRYLLIDVHLKTGDDPAAGVRQLASQGVSVIVADLSADELLRAADAGKADRILFFNVAATDDRLRQKDCRGNIIHTAPSRAML